MSWNLLERFIDSDHFNNDPSLSVAYLSRYADHVGIHFVLCSKLRQFPWSEIEFFLPQLCHLLISVDNDSMALEEFVYDLCEESVNGALLTYLRDLSSDPNSTSFKTCRRIYNKVQRIVFGGADPVKREKIKENVLPVTVFSSIVLAAVAAPFLPKHAGPLAIAQARKPRPAEDIISDNVQPQKLGRSHTVAGNASVPQRTQRAQGGQSDPEDNRARRAPARSPVSSPKAAEGPNSTTNKRPKSSQSRKNARPSLLYLSESNGARLSSSSLPDFQSAKPSTLLTPPPTAGSNSKQHYTPRRHSHHIRSTSLSSLTRSQKIRMLRSNYFRSETQFLQALEDISNRLVSVPKPARLSALRAELALIAQDLPAEVDIPVICPAILYDGTAANSKHHRIVRLNPAEATSLNSAEKVPYLLIVEILREDFDFDPDTEGNQKLLNELIVEKNTATKRRIFDITDSSKSEVQQKPMAANTDSVFEPANGDLGSTPLLKDPSYEDMSGRIARMAIAHDESGSARKQAAPSQVGGYAATPMQAGNVLRTTPGDRSRSGSPGLRKQAPQVGGKNQSYDQLDFSALATHMRTAAQMLAQLESSSSKRPRTEVAAIKAKIIASMQSLEEQSFLEGSTGPIFESIMGNTDPTAITTEPDMFEDGTETTPDPGLASGKGSARMENDQKTGGFQRKGDRDDPSAATFGEEWAVKKERIRRSSPFGWMKNWDVISVIVKTGADLRQESFACQLIQVCSKIWTEADVPVWIKRMQILVTGESSGLIETITNGVSLHSLKRSLTLASIAAGTNTRKQIATLKDHFLKTFGGPESDAYTAGADAFARSLAAYSIISYILQLKDRHNGNILIDNAGHIIHIDFGFMLSNTPGSMGFEAAPFKLTQEYVDVLGGTGAPAFESYKSLCKQAFQALRKEAERIVMLVELMGRQSKMPCFAVGVQQAVSALNARFVLHLSRDEAENFVEDLISKSLGSYYTRLYDTFQYRTQGIY